MDCRHNTTKSFKVFVSTQILPKNEVKMENSAKSEKEEFKNYRPRTDSGICANLHTQYKSQKNLNKGDKIALKC